MPNDTIYLMGMKITSVIISLAYTRFMKSSRENALSWSQSVLFFFPLRFPTPTAPFPLSSPSLNPSASFLSQTWILASERKCKWNVRRKEETECYGFETSWQNTAAHTGGHFIENINSHKQHMESSSFQADKTVLWTS